MVSSATRRTDGHRTFVTARTAGLAVALAVGAAACGDDDSDSQPTPPEPYGQNVTIVYRYVDSSVPPEFHRSYTLTISSEAVDVVVDSYGDVLHESTVDLPAGVWDQLAGDPATTQQVAETVAAAEGEDACTGGTSREITVTDGDGEALVATSFEVCGDAQQAAASQLDGYVQPVIDAIPGWQDMLD